MTTLRPALLALPLLAACSSFSPVARGGDPRGFPGEVGAPGAGPAVEAGAGVDHVCRSGARPRGWIATRYTMGDDCPDGRGPQGGYNVAVIERYSHRPVGATMLVCADQAVPRGWVRDSRQHVRASCPGARVRVGRPTVYLMRRVG